MFLPALPLPICARPNTIQAFTMNDLCLSYLLLVISLNYKLGVQ